MPYATQTEYQAEIIENVEFLLETGERLLGVVKRLGYQNVDSLRRVCYRAGREDLFEALVKRENY